MAVILDKFVASQSLVTVFEYLKEVKQAAAKDISAATGLSFPTVMSMIRIGMDCGMIAKGELADSTGGRCAQIYRCNPAWMEILLIRVSANELQYEIRNVLGEKLSGGKQTLSATDIIDTIADLTERFKLIYPNLTVCAVALPCVVTDGVIVDWRRNKTLNGTNFAGVLSDRCGIRFLILNDMKVFALAGEKYCKSKCHSSATVYLDKNALGMGLMLDGKPVEGFSGCAGELGSLPIGLSASGNQTHTVVKVIQSIVAVFNPQYVVLYMARRQEKIAAIIKAVQKAVPAYAMPQIVSAGDDWAGDVLEGLYLSCLRHVKEIL